MAELIKEKGAPGSVAKGFIPLSVPHIKGNEWKYVRECLDTGWVSSVGSYVDRFEKAVAEYTGRAFAIACTSGTAALHTALMVAGVGANDEVILPDLTFAAPAFAVRYVGAWPVLMDIEPEFGQIDIDKLKDFLQKDCSLQQGRLVNRHTQRVVRAVMPVHLLGHSVDMDSLMTLARSFGLVVIEDAAESIGAEYKGRKVGADADIACFSFNGNKIITCGGGGMLATQHRGWAERARHLTTQAKADPVEYTHDAVGYNYRLTNVQAAIGVAQMESLDKYVERKRAIAKRYARELAALPGLILPREAVGTRSTYWLYTVLIDASVYGSDSRSVMKFFASQGVQARPLWQPLHRQDIFEACYAHRIEVADRYYERALSVPSSVGMKRAEQDTVITAFRQLGSGKKCK